MRHPASLSSALPPREQLFEVVAHWATGMRARRLLSELRVDRQVGRYGMAFYAERDESETRWCTSRFVSDEELSDDGERAVIMTLRSIENELEGLGPMRGSIAWEQNYFDPDVEFWRGVALAMNAADRGHNSEAEARASVLFKDIAGQEAYANLMNTGKTPLLGSAGTHYHLHRRCTYSVSRDADGVEFCAVVTGVPLWDHLLGVKLLVERDEPAFLRVANVSPAPTLRRDDWELAHGIANERYSMHRAPLAFDINAVTS